MCGVSGYYSKSYETGVSKYYENHLKLSHRGPDDEGFVCLSDIGLEQFYGNDTVADKRVGQHILSLAKSKLILGHRRLSIIDLSSSGHQPLNFKNLTLVYNGEIFNYIELRSILAEEGYVFETETDTEVFLKAYDFWGEEAFSKFNGMWSAAIYNAATESLTLTRDRFGIKPLYYIWDNDKKCIRFASEIKALVDYLPQRKLNVGNAYSYLRYTEINHNNETFIEGIFSLEPGSYLTLTDNIEIVKYYTLAPNRGDIEYLLKDSVHLRTRTDTELGILLSGGVDSSTLSSFLNEERLSYQIKSFTADFDDERFSEKKYVDEVIASSELDGRFVTPSPESFIDDISDFIETHEYPVRSLSTYLQYKLYENINKNSNVKVVFSGQGADEIFSGYTNDYFIYLASELRKCNLSKYASLLSTFRKVKGFSYLNMIKSSVIYAIRPHYKKYDHYGVFSDKVNFTHVPHCESLSLYKNNQKNSICHSSLREYFRGEDRNSMRFSIEGRFPFMDYRLVEAGVGLREDEMIVDGISKAPLRKIARGKVPDSILDRTDKMGFVSPQEVWQKTELVDIFDATFSQIRKEGLSDFVDAERVYEIYQQYKNNEFHDWAFIWRCFCLKKFIDVWSIK